MSREEKTTQLQTIVDEFKTANTRLEIELPREVGQCVVAVCSSVLQCVAVSIEANARLEMELPREMGQCVVAAWSSV